MDVVRRLLNLVRAHRYQVTEHALESLDEHNLTLNDVVTCLDGGRVRRSWKRQRKYEIEGRALDGRPMRLIARLLSPPLARIITAYEVE
jgi:hypothetical protein